MDSILHIVLAAIALGFLVFIHELGHYLVALKVGMEVEVFSIGFGRPVYSWMRGKVRWQIGWLPFGGYVKIAGMELGKNERTDIPGGFFTKRPFDRLLVAIAGPLANLVFAFLIFIAMWMLGGREKPFAEFTNHIGWVDPKSELFQQGIRPGDVLASYNGKPFNEFKDLLYEAIFSKDAAVLEGYKINEKSGAKTPFKIPVTPYPAPNGVEGFYSYGILSPARYMVYENNQQISENSPIKDSGIEVGDRIVWVNGDLVYSQEQLTSLLNQQKSYLTIERDGNVLSVRVPRVLIPELKLDHSQKEEISDWHYLSGIKGRFSNLYFIPYNINQDLVIENEVSFIDPDLKNQVFEKISEVDGTLQPGDKIVAVDSIKISTPAEFLKTIQKPHALVIVQKGFKQTYPSWKEADKVFNTPEFIQNVSKLAEGIGISQQIQQEGDLLLLKPIIPLTQSQISTTEQAKASLALQKKLIEEISDPQKRSATQRAFDEEQKRLMLGVLLVDEKVVYNPGPFTLFGNILDETWNTLKALVTGQLNPKYLSGPVGIVRVIQHGWSVGIQEALYWMALISINLGFLNLLPIPVLDGGYIVLSLIEMITRKRIKPKTLERLILPFVVLLIGFLIFVTYYDIARLF